MRGKEVVMKGKRFKLVVHPDKGRLWRWTLYSSNHRKVATCGESLTKRAHCLRIAVTLFGHLLS